MSVDQDELSEDEGDDCHHCYVQDVLENVEAIASLLLHEARASEQLVVIVSRSLLMQVNGPAVQIRVQFEHD